MFVVLAAVVLTLALIMTSSPVSQISRFLGADTGGPNSSGLAISTGPGQSWSGLPNVGISDDNRAEAFLKSTKKTSEYLKATNFGFSIPTGADILGIEIGVERNGECTWFLGWHCRIKDEAVRVVKGGSIGAEDKSKSSMWPRFDSSAIYGDSTDLWSETWTAADINSSDFGLAIRARYTGMLSSYKKASIDHVQISVYYSVSGGPRRRADVDFVRPKSILEKFPDGEFDTMMFSLFGIGEEEEEEVETYSEEEEEVVIECEWNKMLARIRQAINGQNVVMSANMIKDVNASITGAALDYKELTDKYGKILSAGEFLGESVAICSVEGFEFSGKRNAMRELRILLRESGLLRSIENIIELYSD